MAPKRELDLSDNESNRSPTPNPIKSPKKTKKNPAPTSPATPSKSPKAKVKSEAGSPGKKMGPWSKEDLLALYGIMNPKKAGVKWDEVAALIPGRDVKACQNKWFRMQAKIMEAIASMGE